jgi:hypothetical protein
VFPDKETMRGVHVANAESHVQLFVWCAADAANVLEAKLTESQRILCQCGVYVSEPCLNGGVERCHLPCCLLLVACCLLLVVWFVSVSEDQSMVGQEACSRLTSRTDIRHPTSDTVPYRTLPVSVVPFLISYRSRLTLCLTGCVLW